VPVQSERLPNSPYTSRKKRHSYARESHFRPRPAPDRKATADKPRPVSLQKNLAAIRDNLSISLGIVVFFLCLALWILIGYVIGKLSPEYMVTLAHPNLFAALLT
jgi:hypothetical protein